MDPGSVSARRNIQIPEENRFSYRDKSSLQLHRDRNILRSRKINSALPIPCNPREFISLFLRARPHIHTHLRYFSNTSASLSLSFLWSLFLPACRKKVWSLSCCFCLFVSPLAFISGGPFLFPIGSHSSLRHLPSSCPRLSLSSWRNKRKFRPRFIFIKELIFIRPPGG